MTDAPAPPPALDAIVDKVLRYHPPEKGQSARKKKAKDDGR